MTAKQKAADKRGGAAVSTQAGEENTLTKKPRASEKKSATREKKATREAVNRDVEQALLRKATGYCYVQQESYKLKHVEYEELTGKKKQEWESVEVVDVEKYVPAEYSAIALWLKARMPETWGDAAQPLTAEPVIIVDDIPAQCGGEGLSMSVAQGCVGQPASNADEAECGVRQ